MKVFISHQHTDSALAVRIASRLRVNHRIDSYLDVIDENFGSQGADLAAHVRAELGKCTQLLAVVSDRTQTSWWVPWEIGVASEKDFPLATYAGGPTPPPEYLRKWPYLRNDAELDAYARASQAAASEFRTARTTYTEVTSRRRSTTEFYRSMKASLGR